MHIFSLVFGALLLLTPFRDEKSIPLEEALQAGMVQLEVSGEGGFSNKSLRLKITNLHKKKSWKLEVPAGLVFHSQDTSLQDLILIRSQVLAMQKDRSKTLLTYGMCTQASNGSPDKGSVFQLSGMTTGNLKKVVNFIDQKRILDDPAQYAIWAVTDDKPIHHIDHEELRAFTAQTLGKENPVYAVVNTPLRARPEAPAYNPEPAIVKGTFEYQTNIDIQASFGLFNAEGEELHPFFTDQQQHKGQHRFKFYFEVRGLSAGTYYARLHAQGQTIKELKIDLD